MKIKLKRNYLEKQTESLVEVFENNAIIYLCKALELPWDANFENKSCIPAGYYPITKEIQQTRGKVIRVHNVKGRSDILIHKGNFITHTKGCILVGESLIDINNDKLKDVTNSKATMDKLYDLLPDNDHNFLEIIF